MANELIASPNICIQYQVSQANPPYAEAIPNICSTNPTMDTDSDPPTSIPTARARGICSAIYHIIEHGINILGYKNGAFGGQFSRGANFLQNLRIIIESGLLHEEEKNVFMLYAEEWYYHRQTLDSATNRNIKSLDTQQLRKVFLEDARKRGRYIPDRQWELLLMNVKDLSKGEKPEVGATEVSMADKEGNDISKSSEKLKSVSPISNPLTPGGSGWPGLSPTIYGDSFSHQSLPSSPSSQPQSDPKQSPRSPRPATEQPQPVSLESANILEIASSEEETPLDEEGLKEWILAHFDKYKIQPSPGLVDENDVKFVNLDDEEFGAVHDIAQTSNKRPSEKFAEGDVVDPNDISYDDNHPDGPFMGASIRLALTEARRIRASMSHDGSQHPVPREESDFEKGRALDGDLLAYLKRTHSQTHIPDLQDADFNNEIDSIVAEPPQKSVKTTYEGKGK